MTSLIVVEIREGCAGTLHGIGRCVGLHMIEWDGGLGTGALCGTSSNLRVQQECNSILEVQRL
jgi:hypothetical protein